jgi:hypothetical protein
LRYSLRSLFACLTGSSPDSLSQTAYSLPYTLAQSLAEVADALTEPAEGLACRAADLPDGTARTERLTGRVCQATERLGRRASRLYRLPRRLPHVAEGLRDRSAGTEGLLAQLADAAQRVVHRVDEALEDLRVPVEGRQGTIEDVVEVLEPDLQFGLSLDAFDVDLDLPQVDVHSRHDLEEIRELRSQSQVRLELLDVDVDLVDFHLSDVDVDVRIVARLAAFEARGIKLASGAGSARRAISPSSVPALSARTLTRSRALRCHGDLLSSSLPLTPFPHRAPSNG